MASNINPSNIDGTFPIVGVSNNSQGFRDNFTNIKTNLGFARDEIEDLQGRSVVTRDVASNPVDNNMLGSTISNVYFKSASDIVVNHNTQSGAVTLRFDEGAYHKITTNGPIVLDLDWTGLNNLIPSYGVVRVNITVANLGDTITFPVEAWSGISSLVGFTNGEYSPVIGEYVFELSTTDGGASVLATALLFPTSDINSTRLADVTTIAADVATLQSNVELLQSYSNLLDIEITANTLINGDKLTYDASISKWVNGDVEHYAITILETGAGGQEVYAIDGTMIKTQFGVTTMPVKFVIGKTYRFDVSDPSNIDVPFSFSSTPDTIVEDGNINNTVTAWSNNVTRRGDSGTAGAYVEIRITADTPNPLYFYGQQIPPHLDTSKLGAEYPVYILGECCYTDGKPANITTTSVFTSNTSDTSGNSNVATTTSVITATNIHRLDGNIQPTVTGPVYTETGVLDSNIANITVTNTTVSTGEVTGDLDPLRSPLMFFTTVAPTTAILTDKAADGMKTTLIANDVTAGNALVISVDSAGWKPLSNSVPTSGNVTFNAIGQTATLQFINNKWFCIGNNGATFS